MAHVEKDAHVTAAIIASRQPAMQTAAKKVLRSVKSVASRHRSTGNYESKLAIESVRTRQGVIDLLVVADDPDAQLIEFGGIVKATGRKIPGLWIMSRGLRRVK